MYIHNFFNILTYFSVDKSQIPREFDRFDDSYLYEFLKTKLKAISHKISTHIQS